MKTLLRNNMLPLVLALLGVAASLYAASLARTIDNDKVLSAFEQSANNHFFAIEKEITLNLNVARVIKGYLTGDSFSSRADFHNFTQLFLDNIESIQAIEWVPRVTRSMRSEFEQRARGDGFTDFTFKELNVFSELTVSSDKPVYYPVYYVEPLLGNEAALGLDLGSNPTRLEAIEIAEAKRTQMATSKVTLVQETEGQSGVLIIEPVFSGPEADGSSNSDEKPKGFALIVVRVGDMVERAIKGLPRDVEIDLIDVSNASEVEALSGIIRKPDEVRLQRKMEIFVAGRIWQIVATPRVGFFEVKTNATAISVLIVGLIITSILTIYTIQMVRQKEMISSEVKYKTKELSTTLNAMADGLLVFDSSGRIERVNASIEKIFYYTTNEALRLNVKAIAPEIFGRDNWEREFKETIGSQSENSGAVLETSGLRKDGESFPMELSVAQMESHGKKKYIANLRDVTERNEIERVKGEFVATVSHELRTPLTSIKGAVALLESGSLGDLPVEAEKMVHIANKNVDRLSNLVNDLLDFEKLASGKMVFSFDDIDLHYLLSQSVDLITPYADSLGISLHYKGCSDDSMVYCDEERIAQVVTNLLSNAIKFSSHGDRVDIELSIDGVNATVTIIDHGAGMPLTKQKGLFERFVQLDQSDTRTKGGTGLGLAISKAVIDGHKGDIWFSSSEGQGSSFYFTIPLN